MHALEGLADGILVINLDERADRWQALVDEFEPYIDVARLQRLPAVKGTAIEGFAKPPFFRGGKRDKTWAGRGGCVLSHRKAIEHAARMGWSRVLIFEDDVHLSDDFGRVCGALTESLAGRPWDICYLGFTDPIGPFRKVADLGSEHSLYRLYGCNTAHAYLLRDTVYGFLLEKLPDTGSIWNWLARNRAVDRWYSRTLSRRFKVFAITPSIVSQKQGISDITGRSQEYDHQTEVAANTAAFLPYGIATRVRHVVSAALNGYDALRGFIKRFKGF